MCNISPNSAVKQRHGELHYVAGLAWADTWKNLLEISMNSCQSSKFHIFLHRKGAKRSQTPHPTHPTHPTHSHLNETLRWDSWVAKLCKKHFLAPTWWNTMNYCFLWSCKCQNIQAPQTQQVKIHSYISRYTQRKNTEVKAMKKNEVSEKIWMKHLEHMDVFGCALSWDVSLHRVLLPASNPMPTLTSPSWLDGDVKHLWQDVSQE